MLLGHGFGHGSVTIRGLPQSHSITLGRPDCPVEGQVEGQRWRVKSCNQHRWRARSCNHTSPARRGEVAKGSSSRIETEAGYLGRVGQCKTRPQSEVERQKEKLKRREVA